MGLGSSTPKRKIYYLSPRANDLIDGKKVTRPHFKVTMTDEKGAKHTLADETEVSGNLLSIGHGEYEYPKDSGKKVKTINLYLVDGDALFKIEASINTNMIRGLMNTVAGTKKFDNMRISLYTKNDYAQLFVSNNEEKCQWRFDYEKDLKPKITEAPDPSDESKMIKIYHQVNKMLLEAWIETEPIVKEHATKMGYGAKPVESASTEERTLQQDLDDIKMEDLEQGGALNQPAPIDDSDDLPF